MNKQKKKTRKKELNNNHALSQIVSYGNSIDFYNNYPKSHTYHDFQLVDDVNYSNSAWKLNIVIKVHKNR